MNWPGGLSISSTTLKKDLHNAFAPAAPGYDGMQPREMLQMKGYKPRPKRMGDIYNMNFTRTVLTPEEKEQNRRAEAAVEFRSIISPRTKLGTNNLGPSDRNLGLVRILDPQTEGIVDRMPVFENTPTPRFRAGLRNPYTGLTELPQATEYHHGTHTWHNDMPEPRMVMRSGSFQNQPQDSVTHQRKEHVTESEYQWSSKVKALPELQHDHISWTGFRWDQQEKEHPYYNPEHIIQLTQQRVQHETNPGQEGAYYQNINEDVYNTSGKSSVEHLVETPRAGGPLHLPNPIFQSLVDHYKSPHEDSMMPVFRAPHLPHHQIPQQAQFSERTRETGRGGGEGSLRVPSTQHWSQEFSNTDSRWEQPLESHSSIPSLVLPNQHSTPWKEFSSEWDTPLHGPVASLVLPSSSLPQESSPLHDSASTVPHFLSSFSGGALPNSLSPQDSSYRTLDTTYTRPLDYSHMYSLPQQAPLDPSFTVHETMTSGFSAYPSTISLPMSQPLFEGRYPQERAPGAASLSTLSLPLGHQPEFSSYQTREQLAGKMDVSSIPMPVNLSTIPSSEHQWKLDSDQETGIHPLSLVSGWKLPERVPEMSVVSSSREEIVRSMGDLRVPYRTTAPHAEDRYRAHDSSFHAAQGTMHVPYRNQQAFSQEGDSYHDTQQHMQSQQYDLMVPGIKIPSVAPPYQEGLSTRMSNREALETVVSEHPEYENKSRYESINDHHLSMERSVEGRIDYKKEVEIQEKDPRHQSVGGHSGFGKGQPFEQCQDGAVGKQDRIDHAKAFRASTTPTRMRQRRPEQQKARTQWI